MSGLVGKLLDTGQWDNVLRSLSAERAADTLAARDAEIARKDAALRAAESWFQDHFLGNADDAEPVFSQIVQALGGQHEG